MQAYDLITDRIIEALEAGTVPWRMPWNAETDTPRSLATGKPYRGVNVFMLLYTSLARGYSSPYWLTFNQAKSRGAKVRKGEKGTPVVLWKPTEYEDKETGEKRKGLFLRYFWVFNAEQCDGLEVPTVEVSRDHEPIEAAESIVDGFADGPSIGHGGNSAHYLPSADHVQMPAPETFEDGAAYYATLFHELTHSTGHEKRLDRTFGRFGDGPYSREELVAELGACFLLSEAGLDPRFDQSAAYIESWLRALRDDRKMIVTAAAAAQKAADLILGRIPAVEETPARDLATAAA